jgi:multiple sugar transport system substrate-binding protein
MTKHISRRDFIKAAAALSGGTLLAACAQPPAAPTAAPAQPTAAPAQPTAAPAKPTTAPAASGGKKTISFSSYTWSSFDGAMNQILDEFEKANPGVTVERQLFAGDGYWDKLQTQIAAGTSPDVGMADYGHTVSYAKGGVLLDITDMVAQSGFPLAKMVPAAVSHYRWKTGDFDSGAPDGRLYGLPSDAQSHVFAYNKTLFDAAGVSYPTDDWTWDDLLAAAKKLTDPKKNTYGVYANATFSAGNFQMPQRGVWVKAAGGAFHTPDYKKSLLDSPETMAAFKWLWDLIYTHKVSPPPQSSNDVSVDPFITKQAAMSFAGVWWLTDVANAYKPEEWDVAMFPKHPKTGKRTTTVESDGWWIYKGTKEPALAFSLLQFLANQAGQKKFNDVGYVIPSCFPDVATPWYAQNPPAHKSKLLDNIVQDSTKVDITYFDNATVNAVVGPIIDKAFTDGTDIEAALKDAASAMNDELAKAWNHFNQS